MKRSLRYAGLWAWMPILIVAVVAFASVAMAVTGPGLLNPGFEQGLLNWRVTPTATDQAVVVGTEGPRDFPVYASRGTTVTPFSGDSMLRLGTPRPKGHRLPGPGGKTVVSQTFVSSSSTMCVAMRVFTWDYDDEDRVDIELTNASGRHVGRLSPVCRIKMTDGRFDSHDCMPFGIKHHSFLHNALLDTGWVTLRISGVPTGESLTLTYSLESPRNSSHPTWAYFDNKNQPPTVVATRAFITDKNTPTAVGARGVLEGAVDPDGDTLQSVVVTPTSHGMLNLQTDGSFSYAPFYGYVGSDSFTFKATDGQADSNIGTVNITVNSVNDYPRPDDFTVATPEDTPLHITLPYTSPLGSPLDYFIVAYPTHGTLTGTAPNLEYSPEPNYNGPDSFTYYATDGVLYWIVGTGWITVTPVNDPPIAYDVEALTCEGTPVEVTLHGSDIDGDAISFQSANPPAHGHLSSIVADKVTFTPDAGYYGPDSFTYQASDGTTYSPSATITITVDPLVAMFEYAPTDPHEGEYVHLLGGRSHIVEPGESILEWGWMVSGPGGFTSTVEGENSLFMPPVEGSYDVTLTVVDTRGATATTHTAIPVVHDNSPTGVGHTYATPVNATLTVDVPGVLGGATDPDDDSLQALVASPPVNGTVALSTDGSFVYVPTSGYHGQDEFTFMVSDGTKVSLPATVAVNMVNRPPVAHFKVKDPNPHEGDQVGLWSSEYSSDPDEAYGDKIVSRKWTLTYTDPVTHESQVDSATQADLLWIPPWNGQYTIKLQVQDSFGAVAETQTIMIAGEFPPIANSLNVEALSGTPAPLLGRFLDQGWLDPHTASWSFAGATPAGVADDRIAAITSGEASASVTVEGTPGDIFTGALTVSDDSTSASDPATITLVAPDPNRHEPANDSLATAPQLKGDGSYLSYIGKPRDADFYEVVMPDGDELPFGTQVLAKLRDLPADYDLVILESVPATSYTFQNTGGMHTPIDSAGGMHTPIDDTGGMHTGGMHTPIDDTGGMHTPIEYAAFDDAGGMHTGGMHTPFDDTGGMHTGGMHTPYEEAGGMHTGGMHTPFEDAGGMHTGGMHTPLAHLAFTHAGGMHTGGMHTGGMHTGGMHTPLDGYPISELSYTGLGAGNANGVDVSFSELGLEFDQAHYKVIGTSANRGLDDEVILAATDIPTSHLYVAIVGPNGAFSDAPYRLNLETSRPFDLVSYANEGVTHEPIVENGTSNTEPVKTTPHPKTLFVTQEQRLASLYGQTEADALIADLKSLCDHPKIQGTIISVPSDIYDPWDQNPSDVAVANEVANGVRTAIDQYLTTNPNIEYVVLVGNDRIIPHRRVIDETDFCNERNYTSGSFQKADSPLLASIYGGYNLTDDFYVDELPAAWQGRALYVPDRSISRLVETPAEMRTVIATFIDNDGNLKPQTAVLSAMSAGVTGYDFFVDGAHATAAALRSAGIETTEVVTSDWTAEQIRSEFLATPKSISDITAHFMHFLGLSANGFLENKQGVLDYDEFLLSQQVASAGTTLVPSLEARLLFSMGCHSGLSVPDRDTVSAGGTDIVPSLDFPQALATQGGVYIANTGYGLGDSDLVALQEDLLRIYAEELVSRGDVGKAMAAAKKRYITSQAALTVYDEKSSIEWTMYGLPQYTMPSTGIPTSGGAAASSGNVAGTDFTLPPLAPTQFTLTVIDGSRVITRTCEYGAVTNARGTYFTTDGEYDSTPFRPVQPRVVVPLEGSGSSMGPIHGVVVSSGSNVELTGFDPVMDRPVTGEEQTPVDEPVISLGQWFPASTAVISSLQSGGNTGQYLVVTPGQYRGDAPTTGTQRLWSDMVVEIQRSTSTDFTQPTVDGVSVDNVGDSQIAVRVTTSDPNGIGHISIFDTQGTTLAEVSDPVPSGPNEYTVIVTLPPETSPGDLSLVVNVTDSAGNVASATGKGYTIKPIDVALASAGDVLVGQPATFTVTVSDFSTLMPPVALALEYGDGQSDPVELTPANVDLDLLNDTATYVAHHTYSAPATLTVLASVNDAQGSTGYGTTVIHVLNPPPPITVSIIRGGQSFYGSGKRVSYSVLLSDYGSLQQPLTYEWDFGDGETASGTVTTVTTDPSGGKVFTTSHLYSSGGVPITAAVRVFDAASRQGMASRVMRPATLTSWASTLGSDTAGNGTRENPYRTLQVALDSLMPSGTVYLEPGTYTGSVGLRCSAVIDGEAGGDTVTIRSDSTTSPIVTIPASATSWPYSGSVVATLRGLTITGPTIAAVQSTTGSTAHLERCAVRDTAGGDGVWMYGTTSLSECTFTGCGMAVRAYGDMTLSRCMITDNDSSSTGSAAGFMGGGWHHIEAENCLFARNHSASYGTIFWRGYSATSTATFTNCTIVDNTSEHDAAGAWGDHLNAEYTGPTIFLFNCIETRNTALIPSANSELYGCVVDHSYIETWPQAECTGTNLLTASNGAAGLLADYTLAQDSICADAGWPSWGHITAPASDLLGNSRPFPAGGAYDMGAYELQIPKLLPTVYVSPGGSNDPLLGDGSLTRPFATITYALGHVADGGTVYVDDGSYVDKVYITRPVTIDGDYSGAMATVYSTGEGAAFEVAGTAGVTINGLQITGGGAVTKSSGGGVRAHESTVTISDCVIFNNAAVSGAGVLVGGGPAPACVTIVNCLLAGNSASPRADGFGSGQGGGVYTSALGSVATIINSTIVDNDATYNSGGVGRSGAGVVTMLNSIAYNNMLIPPAPGIPSINDLAPGCDVAYSYTTNPWTGTGSNNLDSTDGPTPFVDYAAGDYSLQPGSVCVDAGRSDYGSLAAPSADILGNPRPYGPKWDMGAYELQVPNRLATVYVSPGGSDLIGDGSLGSPFATISKAATEVADGGTINVAYGTYGENLDITRPVTIVGNANGQKSGLIGTGDGAVVDVMNTSGVTITGFNIGGAGAVQIQGGGGGVSVHDATNVTVSQCAILSNKATAGAGILSSHASEVTAENCTIIGNEAIGSGQVIGSGRGAGAYSNGGVLNVVNCTIVDNTSTSDMSGVAAGADCNLAAGGSIVVFNSILYNNMLASAGTTSVADVAGAATTVAYSYTTNPWAGPGTSNLDGADGLPGFTAGHPYPHSLEPSSVCVDAGTDAYGGLTAPSIDGPGAARPFGPWHDLGAYEVQVPRVLATAFVSTSGADVVSAGAASRPFQSIAYALTQAADSGTVKVANGNYNENVTIDRPVTIDGNYDGTMAKLTGTGVGSSIFVTRTAGDAAIDGLHITGGGATSPVSGGGIRTIGARTSVQNCLIEGNKSLNGGGVYSASTGAVLTVVNCVIAHNTATNGSGGGVQCNTGSATVINSTIADNIAAISAGGVSKNTTATVTATVFNSIVGGNTVSALANDIGSGCDVAFSYTTNPWTGAGTGNRSSAAGLPAFTDPAGNDYSLQPTSVCIDAGTATYFALTAPTTDILGLRRPFGPTWDMGAYELQVPRASSPPPDLVELLKATPSDVGTMSTTFGLGIDVEGDLAVIGEHLHTHSSETTNGDGSFHVYRKVAGKWQHDEEIVAPAGSKEALGVDVKIHNGKIFAGTHDLQRPGDPGSRIGGVVVYAPSGDSWVREAELVPSSAPSGLEIGGRIAVSDDTIVMTCQLAGAPSPTAWVFRYDGSTWNELPPLTTPDSGADWTGAFPSISGDTIVLGSPNDTNDTYTEAGSAYVFRWDRLAWQLETKLTSPHLATGQGFGQSTLIDGDTAYVGAPGSTTTAGTVYVYRRTGTVWSPNGMISPTDSAVADGFGYSLALDGNTLAAGAWKQTPANKAVYRFWYDGASWQQRQKLTGANVATNARFGYQIAMDNDTLLVNGYLSGRGAAHFFGVGTADTTPPTVNITAPANGSTVSGSVTLAAAASDVGQGVDRVEFTVDGRRIDYDTSEPYSVPWNSATVVAGTHTITATVVDRLGYRTPTTISVTVVAGTDTNPPTVSITAPSDGGMSPHAVPVTVEAADSESGIDRVEFRVGGGDVFATDNDPPYATVWNAPLVYSGTHMIRATAFDNAGNSAQDEVAFLLPAGFDMTASGHNTTEYGVKGARTAFDGTQGVTLTWESSIASASLNTSWLVLANFPPAWAPLDPSDGTPLTSISVGQQGAVTTQWEFPTAQVFWASDDPNAPPAAIKGLTKDSVITCEGCHTEINAAGPHGASDNYAIDPNYPGDYSLAELTKYVTANLSYPTSNALYYTPLSASGIAVRSSLSRSATLASRTDGTWGATAVICAKCHDLENVVDYDGVPGGQVGVVGSTNAHNNHHQDVTDGSPQCVNCHVGVPHGWRRPRLLLNTDVDGAPYRDPMQLGTSRTVNGVPLYEWDGSTWQSTTSTATGWNRIGMQSLSAVDKHIPIKDYTGVAPADLNTVNTDDVISWSEASCEACNDHYDTDGIRIVDTP